MSKLWKLQDPAPPEFQKQHPNLGVLLATLLYQRGITDPEAITLFLQPSYTNLTSPFVFRDMQRAVDRIWQAIAANQKIAIYADYDADAVTANAVLQRTFKYLGVNVLSYIPDRFTEGYGLNIEAFKKLQDLGIDLVITVDCGTNSVEVARWCKQQGIDLIITDHHEITGDLPDAFALINPKNPTDAYPDQQITGVGVAFKLAFAVLSQVDKVSSLLASQGKQWVPGWEKWLLDLVSIGTVADCHSLMGENRILVHFGLRVLAKTRWQGLGALMTQAGIDPSTYSLDTTTLGFALAPRINAAGRLEHANVALHLLTTDDAVEAQALASQLDVINQRRQDLTARMVSEAKEQALLLADRPLLLVHNPGWPKGIVGLVAGRLAEQFSKPTIVLESGEQESTGSARSVGSFDIVQALKSVEHLLVKYGGHKQAAGLTLKTENIAQVYEGLLDYARGTLDPNDLKPVLELDAELDADSLNIQTAELVGRLAPFGFGNRKPIFLVSGLRVVGIRLVGQEGKHIQLQLQKDTTQIDAIGFNLGFLAKQLEVGNTIEAAAELLVDSWNGRKKVKLRLLDVHTEARV